MANHSECLDQDTKIWPLLTSAAFPKHHYLCASSGIQTCFRDTSLCNSSSIHAVPQLVWSKN